jgi:hypothetical protein
MSKITGNCIEESARIPTISADFARGSDFTAVFYRENGIFRVLATAPEIKRPPEPVRADVYQLPKRYNGHLRGQK